MKFSIDRRAHRRLPVTLTARILYAAQSHRTAILDLSRGGFLLAPADALSARVGDTIMVEAVLIGQVEAEVVALSSLGIHVKIRNAAPSLNASIRQLVALSKTWCDEGLSRHGWG